MVATATTASAVRSAWLQAQDAVTFAQRDLAHTRYLFGLALPLGQGGEMQRPLAIAIISGLIVQMPLVLIIMPLVVARLGTLRATRESA